MWTSYVSKGLLRLCDKQSKTWLLVEMKFLFRVQLDISLVRCAHSWAIELNTWREIPYLRAPLYCCLSLSPRATLTLLSCVATSRVHHNSMVARCTLTISFIALRLSNIFHFVYKKRKEPRAPALACNLRANGASISANQSARFCKALLQKCFSITLLSFRFCLCFALFSIGIWRSHCISFGNCIIQGDFE